jgi:protein-disulfide isomerase
VLQVEPQIKERFVAEGLVSLAFGHVLDHGNASRLAHQAAECAGRQNPLAFWQLHDLLFERQAQLWNTTAELLTGWGEELGLDGAALSACINDPTVADQVETLDQERRAQGIRLRPSFILNGQIIEGAISYERFVQLFAEQGAVVE